MDLVLLFIGAVFVHNIALSYFLGMCPFIGISGSLASAFGMGIAVMSVMTMAVSVTWPLYNLILVPTGMEYLQYVVFILVIAALVQLVEMVVERSLPQLYASFGVFLPLITVNCAIFGVTLFMVVRRYSYYESIVFSIGSGIGYAVAILAMAAIRQRLIFSDIPEGLKGAGITMIVAGLMAIGFMGFAGMINIQ